MADEEDVILLNDVSFGRTRLMLGMGGLRRMHVVRMGEPVNQEKWIGMIPAQSREEARWFAWSEGKVIQRYHLSFWWPCREVIDVITSDGKVAPAVMWNEVTGISELVNKALREYLTATGRNPACILVSPSWVSAPDPVTGELRTMRGLAVRDEEWVPEHCVIVY